MDSPETAPATASVDAWFGETTQALAGLNQTLDAGLREVMQSLADLKKTLLEIREMQLARAVLPMAPPVQPAQTYLDFRQPRLAGDIYQKVAFPGSPNAMEVEHGEETGRAKQ